MVIVEPDNKKLKIFLSIDHTRECELAWNRNNVWKPFWIGLEDADLVIPHKGICYICKIEFERTFKSTTTCNNCEIKREERRRLG